MQIRSVGIDLGKTTFHLVALGEHCKVHLSTALFAQIGIGTVRTCPYILVTGESEPRKRPIDNTRRSEQEKRS